MLIFIENKPRAYAWGSSDALPELLGVNPTGDPQAELWLGDHPDDPAEVAKATPVKRTTIDLIQADPELYGVDGGPLPFMLKVLAIGAPLSLQTHPSREQARAGLAREDAAGLPHDAPTRNYRDDNHKPELLVALTQVRALAGFRPVEDARRDLSLLAAGARSKGDTEGADALVAATALLRGGDPEAQRGAFITWVFAGGREVEWALAALASNCEAVGDPGRAVTLSEIFAHHPADPGALVSLLLNHVTLAPGEAVYLPVRHLHAYVSGVAVEVMASSDNVLRAGLTSKHIDTAELLRVADTSTLEQPRFPHVVQGNGLVAWRPDVTDFELLRARVSDPESSRPSREGAAARVSVPASTPLVLIVVEGCVRIARQSELLDEVVRARRGQSLYVSAGGPIELTGDGEVFIASAAR